MEPPVSKSVESYTFKTIMEDSARTFAPDATSDVNNATLVPVTVHNVPPVFTF